MALIEPADCRAPFPLPHWGNLWDPRSAAEAEEDPAPGARNIPLDELNSRIAELPPKALPVRIAAEGPNLSRACRILAQLGRTGLPWDSKEGTARPEPNRMWRPSPFLEEVISQLGAPANALDLACGAGREALLMASWGWQVEALDVLPEALAIARSLEERYSHSSAPRVRWLQDDLETSELALPSQIGLVTCFRFLHRPLFAAIKEALAPGGILVVETFTEEHRRHFGKPKRDRFVLAKGELLSLASGLEVMHHEEDWHEGAHTARLWARRP